MEKHGERSGYKRKHEIKEYRAWINMKVRCLNPNSKAYPYYGARGIKVCRAWMHSYLAFLSAVGRAPSQSHLLDRIDNNGHYTPENCRWVTAKESANNRRHIRKNKITMKDAQWIRKIYTGIWGQKIRMAEKYGVTSSLIGQVIANKIWKEPHLDLSPKNEKKIE